MTNEKRAQVLCSLLLFGETKRGLLLGSLNVFAPSRIVEWFGGSFNFARCCEAQKTRDKLASEWKAHTDRASLPPISLSSLVLVFFCLGRWCPSRRRMALLEEVETGVLTMLSKEVRQALRGYCPQSIREGLVSWRFHSFRNGTGRVCSNLAALLPWFVGKRGCAKTHGSMVRGRPGKCHAAVVLNRVLWLKITPRCSKVKSPPPPDAFPTFNTTPPPIPPADSNLTYPTGGGETRSPGRAPKGSRSVRRPLL